MPTSGKVFRLTEDITLEEIKKRIEGFAEKAESAGYELVADISSVREGINDLYGRYKFDALIEKWHRDVSRVIPYTTAAPFLFFEYKGNMYLLVIIKKSIANYVANRLSDIIFEEVGVIIECRIRSNQLKNYTKENEETKIMLLTDFLLPGMNKLTIYGDDVLETQPHTDYAGDGETSYIVLKSKLTGYTVGITEEASVTIFSTVDEEGFIEYIKDEILSMI